MYSLTVGVLAEKGGVGGKGEAPCRGVQEALSPCPWQ